MGFKIYQKSTCLGCRKLFSKGQLNKKKICAICVEKESQGLLEFRKCMFCKRMVYFFKPRIICSSCCKKGLTIERSREMYDRNKFFSLVLLFSLTVGSIPLYADPDPKPAPAPIEKGWKDELIRRAGDIVVGVAITVIGNAVTKPATPTPSPSPRPVPPSGGENRGSDPDPIAHPGPGPQFGNH